VRGDPVPSGTFQFSVHWGELMAAPTVSVIVPFRNGRELVVEQFEALTRQTFDEPWELILVDNGSTDGTGTLLEPKLRTLRDGGPERAVLVQYAERLGHASPRNFGVTQSSGAALVFCDADDLVSEGWLAALVRVGREAGFATSKTVPLDGALMGADAASVAPIYGGRLPTKFGLPVAHTCGMYCSRDLFERLNGFDPYFDVGGADVDFSLRALRAGEHPILAEEALYFYRARPSSSTAFRQGYRFGRSDVRLYKRHAEYIGYEPSPWSLVAHRAVDAARRSPRLFSADTRGIWLSQVGNHLARLVWSARLRIRRF
jgi:glycosyltransferase involved in cell wall biosynthesis